MKRFIIGEGHKGSGAGTRWFDQNWCVFSSRSEARRAASAQIAKIPFPLASWIAKTYYPNEVISDGE